MDLIKEIEKEQLRTSIPQFHVGDTVDVHVKSVEGERERVHVFTGIVISRTGSGLREMFTVRRIVAGEGVERVFPLHSPAITAIRVVRAGSVRRAKLHYLRQRVGKATRVKEKRAESTKATQEAAEPAGSAPDPAAP